MAGFEQGFADTERAAALTVKSAGDVTRAARALERAAKTGSINAMRRAQAELHTAISALNEEVANAGECWPFQPDDEEGYLRDHFAEELRAESGARGLRIYQRDEQLIASPSIIRILPGARAVRIDQKQISTIRPSHLAGLLRARQENPARFNGRNFIDALYSAYTMLTGGRSTRQRLEGSQFPAIPLARIYELITVMPGTSREYSRTDFARDLYRLDTDGPRATRRGHRLHFHSGRQSPIAFVTADGHIITYHSIAFSEGDNG